MTLPPAPPSRWRSRCGPVTAARPLWGSISGSRQAGLFPVNPGGSDDRKHDDVSALDELFRATLEYRRSKAYFDLMKFISRFPKYAPFNCFLLHTQNPDLSYVATPFQWWSEFERKVKPDARPLVILVPFGPVSFVYDLMDTEGKRLPRLLERPYETWGNHVPDVIKVAGYIESLGHKELEPRKPKTKTSTP